MNTHDTCFYYNYILGVTHREILEPLTKQELISLCKLHGMKGYSKYNKDALIDRLCAWLRDPAVITRYFLCLNDEEILYMQMAQDAGGMYEDVEPEAYSFLICGGYAGFTKDMEFGIPLEVLAAFKEIDTGEFEERRTRICLIGNYAHVTNYLYGVVPPMQVVKLFNTYEKKKTDWAEVMEVYDAIAGIRCDFIYEDAYFVDLSFAQSYQDLLAMQGNIPFYIPTQEEMEEWFAYGFSGDREDLLELYDYITQSLWVEEETGSDACFLVDSLVHLGCTTQDLWEVMRMFGIRCRTKRQEQELLMILQHMAQDTRMIIYRGHTAREAHRKE